MDKFEAYTNKSNGTVHLSVSNFSKYKKLVEQAKKQADELQRTINQLENFDIDIDFCTD